MRDDLFVAVHDTFFTDTCDYADIVLPADTQLEHMDLHGAYGHYYFGLSMPAIAKARREPGQPRAVSQACHGNGYSDPCFTQSDEEMIRELIDPAFNPLFEGVTFEMLQERGWARAAIESPRRIGLNSGKWPTPSGKIEIYSQTLAERGLDPLPSYTPKQRDARTRKRAQATRCKSSARRRTISSARPSKKYRG